MDSFKKYELKQKLKKYKPLLIGSGIFLVIGIIAFIVGCYMSGANLVEWLTGAFAITCYIIIFIGLCVLGLILFLLNKRDGGKKYDDYNKTTRKH